MKETDTIASYIMDDQAHTKTAQGMDWEVAVKSDPLVLLQSEFFEITKVSSVVEDRVFTILDPVGGVTPKVKKFKNSLPSLQQHNWKVDFYCERIYKQNLLVGYLFHHDFSLSLNSPLFTTGAFVSWAFTLTFNYDKINFKQFLNSVSYTVFTTFLTNIEIMRGTVALNRRGVTILSLVSGVTKAASSLKDAIQVQISWSVDLPTFKSLSQYAVEVSNDFFMYFNQLQPYLYFNDRVRSGFPTIPPRLMSREQRLFVPTRFELESSGDESDDSDSFELVDSS